MAVRASVHAVSATPTRLAAGIDTDAHENQRRVLLRNPGATAITIGGPDVTASSGYSLPSGAQVHLDGVRAGDHIYVVATMPGTVHVLEWGI